MRKPRHTVTDHALLRYLERRVGIDVEALRCELGHRVDAAVAGHRGACAVNIEGLQFRLTEEGVVVTVVKRDRANIRTGRKRR